MKRVPALVLLTVVTGCTTGLDGAPPLDEAEHAPPPELVAQVHALPDTAADDVIVDGRLWVPWGLPADLRGAVLRPVGSAHGLTVYARAWDRSPYDELFARRDGEWRRYAPVIGRSGAAPAAAH